MKLPASVKNITARRLIHDGRRVEVAFHHSGDTFPPKTLRDMIRDANWSVAELKRLRLVSIRGKRARGGNIKGLLWLPSPPVSNDRRKRES